MIERAIVEASIFNFVKASLDPKPIGWGSVPGSNPAMPYAIIYSSSGPPDTGSIGNPHEDRCFMLQFKSVGRGSEQAGWMSDRVRELLLGMPAVEIPVPNCAIYYRELNTSGPIVKSGDTIWEVSDLYRFWVTPSN